MNRQTDRHTDSQALCCCSTLTTMAAASVTNTHCYPIATKHLLLNCVHHSILYTASAYK